MSSPIPLLRLAGTLLLSGALIWSYSPPAAAAPETTVDGVVRTLAADTVEPGGPPGKFHGHSEDIYRQVLTVGDKTYFLKGKKAPKNNSRVRATGAVEGRDFTATQITTLGTVAGMPETGTTRVLAMLAYWTAPDGVTQASANSQLFTDSNGWFRDASYTALGQAGKVTPWLRIPPPTTGCYADHVTMMDDAKAAATALGYNMVNYDNFVLYFPNCGGDAADFGGWAYVDGVGTWLNGYMDRRVTVHEQGHNYGLWHSHSNMCSSGGLGGSCSFEDYGDPYDAMGSSGYVGHFNASQKSVLGWMGGRTVDLTRGGTATLVPMSSDSATSARAAVVRTDTSRQYWLEYRQPIDYDSWLPSEGTDGVLVHVSGDGSGGSDTGASLIDVRPGDGISQYSSTLRAGQSWTTPEGTRIAVGQVTATGAGVTVTPRTVSVPTVTAKNPAPGATGVPIGTSTSRTPMKATFSEAVTGVSGSTFTLRQGTTAVAAAVSYNATTRMATLMPAAPLTADRTYTLSLTSGIKSASGGALAAQSWNFITGPRPTVTAVSPASGATGVAVGTTTTRPAVTATFSEPVTGLPTTAASTGAFTLKLGTTVVASKVSYNATTKVATLRPDAPLVTDRTYTASLTTSVKDAAGNPIAAKTWTFITGPRPTVTARTPSSGATGVSRTANASATFSETVTGLPATAAASSAFTVKLASTGAVVASAVSYNSTTRVATLNPSATLLANTTYTLTLTSGIKDRAGNPLTTLSWSFVTGAT